MRAGRNDPCPCGSGKKYKKCCLAKDQEKQRQQVEVERVQMATRAVGNWSHEEEPAANMRAAMGES